MRSRYFGDRHFYRKVLTVAVPIMIQQGITNFVNMLDNIMVGRLGTDPMSGVAILNQLMFIFNLCVFGGLSGIGIFTAQFYGKKDTEGVRYTFRMQVILSFLLAALGTAVLLLTGSSLISLYLTEDGGGGNIQATFSYAKEYLAVMYAGMLPFALSQTYSSTLRNTGETIVPMKAGLIAVAVNLAGNYILIYGKFGAPALGVEGAAAATVLSRFVELIYVAGWTHKNAGRNAFITGAWKRLFDVPAALAGRISIKALPLLVNETLWSGGMAMLTQCYSVRGLSAVAAHNISQTFNNVFNVSFIAMGNAIAIILGQTLGSGDIKRAKEESVKLTVFSVLICMGVGFCLFIAGGFFPLIYNTSDEIRRTASGLIRISAVCMPLYAYVNASYFTLRSGGKTGITFLFDSCYMWVIAVPAAFVLAHFTGLSLLWMYFMVQMADIIKCIIGYFLMKSGIWAQDLTKR
ncbi:MAG: MATE family efflux transporter [Lachnospiraceae bacterium]|nr:MATE family efflux transporter [Lachnospiraceae bacterium]